MAALQTLTVDQRLALANALVGTGATVFKNIQSTPIHDAVAVTAQLAALKVLVDGAQG